MSGHCIYVAPLYPLLLLIIPPLFLAISISQYMYVYICRWHCLCLSVCLSLSERSSKRQLHHPPPPLPSSKKASNSSRKQCLTHLSTHPMFVQTEAQHLDADGMAGGWVVERWFYCWGRASDQQRRHYMERDSKRRLTRLYGKEMERSDYNITITCVQATVKIIYILLLLLLLKYGF